MSIADADYQFFSKVVILTDSSNYAEWERLIQTTEKDQYSASVGSHQAQLLQQMWL